MKQIDAKHSTMEEAFSLALKEQYDLEITCSDGKFVLKCGALLKMPKGTQKVLVWTGKEWRNIGK